MRISTSIGAGFSPTGQINKNSIGFSRNLKWVVLYEKFLFGVMMRLLRYARNDGGGW